MRTCLVMLLTLLEAPSSARKSRRLSLTSPTPSAATACRNISNGCHARFHFNVTRTPPGLASHRSSLTIDEWMAAEAARPWARDVFQVFTRCHERPAPSPRKVARHVLEMLRKLEGDHGVMKDFIRTLIRAKILVEVASYESEPDLESLVKTPEVLRAEPHTTFPRITALVWIAVTAVNETNGWCFLEKVAHFLKACEAKEAVHQLRSLNIVMGKARRVIDSFIQHFPAANMFLTRNHTHKFLRNALMTSEATSIGTEVLGPVFSEAVDPVRNNESCSRIHPSQADIVHQFVDMLPYLDREDDSNDLFLAKYRTTVDQLLKSGDALDREAAYHAATLTPIILLKNERNTWCCVEKFQRALRLFHESRPSEKRRALSQLRIFETAKQRVDEIIKALPTPVIAPSTPSVKEFLTDDKELGYIEEIIKNFG